MTRERAKELLPVIQAFAEGKAIEWKCRGGANWCGPLTNPIWSDDNIFRIKPELRLRPWRPEEVPMGAVVVYKRNPIVRRLIVGITSDGHVYLGDSLIEQCSAMLEQWLLPDNKPCGVEDPT